MYLGLDLRGGVHFLLQVDMQAALDQAHREPAPADMRAPLRDKNIRHAGITREGQTLRDPLPRRGDARRRRASVIGQHQPDLALVERDDGQDLMLVATLKPEAQKPIQEAAVKQNIVTLNKRVNELGVAEPVIQQQGADRIVVQLPGVQDIGAREGHPRPHRDARSAPGRRGGDAHRQHGQRRDPFPERQRDGTATPVPTKKQVVDHRRPVHRRAGDLRPGPAARGVGRPRPGRAGASCGR